MILKPNVSHAQDDDRFLRLAFDERLKSDDPKARYVDKSGVGVVIVQGDRIVSRSANVLPPPLKAHHDREGMEVQEAERYHFIEHAERAAIFKAVNEGTPLAGATLYCTRFPCSDCARAMVWMGIGRVVVGADLDSDGRWVETQRAANEILKLADLSVRVLPKGEIDGVAKAIG